MKLELKHLAPYLPYQLKLLVERQGKFNNEANITQVEDWKMQDLDAPFSKRYRVVSCKPLLIPLSELKNTIEFMPSSLEDWADGKLKCVITDLPYCILVILFERHFDVFDLIPAGLALNKLDHI